jgi:O-acetyl-ADP-ribose deacetylase (regulator of RNase III)
MISFVNKNLFKLEAEALINPVNLRGVIGPGLAKQFKEKFPNNFIIYINWCKGYYSSIFGNAEIGNLLIYFENNKYIINFPTRKDWYQESKIEYIELGLNNLIFNINKYKWKSIVIPPLGCGLGKLEWAVVKPLIVSKLQKVEKEINIYIIEPRRS